VPQARSASLAFFLAVLALGCAVHSPQDRTTVSDSLQARTGHALRPPEEAGVPQGVDLADGLTEDEAVAIALWNNLELEATLAELGLARADLVEAGLIKNPAFSLLFPLGPKQMEFTLTWPIDVLWQRPRRVAAAKFDVERTAARLVQSGLDVVRDAKGAHADLVLAEERARLAQESKEVRDRIATIAEVRLRVGDLSPLEAALTEIDAARAKDDVTRAARDAKLFRERLLSFLGLPADGAAFEVLAPSSSRAEIADVPALLKEAYAARPELRAAELGMEAAGARAGLARSEVLTLAALLDANSEGKEGFEMGPGLAFEIPLFGRNKGRLARAEAELELLARRYAAARERIALEVRQARISLLAARESLALWQTRILPSFEESLSRTEKSKDAGEASELEVLAARRSFLDARLQEAEARAALGKAEAALEHAAGKSLVSSTLDRSEAQP
jgi:cobalt-zinc-cadmium efflux system outer membrane protein